MKTRSGRSAAPELVDVLSAMEQALQRRGRVNVLVAGRTGVGKSTLVNAVFQGDLAHTGQGRPVTRGTREIVKEGVPVSIFDTRGLELAEFRSTLAALEDFVRERAGDRDPQRHVHVAWVCVAEDSRRVEQAESDLVRTLSRYMPVLVVVTKARSDQGFRAEVQRLAPEARGVVRVRAIPEEYDDGHAMPPMGLVPLVDATMEVVPEGQRNAFVAAQKVDVEAKRKRARAVVASAATAAGAIGATPIPFSDAALLVPVQVAMLAGITAVFGLPLSEAFLRTLVASAVTGTGATLTGRAVATGLLKLLPGAQVAASGISALTAATLTSAFGEAYVATLTHLHREGVTPPSPEQVVEHFRRERAMARA